MEDGKNWSNVLHFEMGDGYDAVHLSSLILQQRPLSPNNRWWRNVSLSRTMMLNLLRSLEDVIRLASSSMCHSNAAGLELKENG